MDKMVSIIMPVYNVEKYISKSIKSALQQTYTNFELIVVNDGTTDNSLAEVKKFNDKRIRLFNKTNGGLSDTRNFGIQQATGTYIYFLDSDDWIEPTLIEQAVNAIERYKSDVVIFGYFLDTENENGKLISTETVSHPEVVFNRNNNNLTFSKNTLSLMGYAWNKLYHASFIRKNYIRFDTGISLVEDILFNSPIYKIIDKIVFMDEVLYHYINRPNTSLIKSFHENSFELNIQKLVALEAFLESWQLNEVEKKAILAGALVTGIRYCTNNIYTSGKHLTYQQKVTALKKMLHHAKTKYYTRYYQAKTFNDKLYKALILNKASLPLHILCQIKK